MAISLEQLNAFVLTVDQGGFRQAAKQLGKHPSTVSNLVANLEIDLGYELFVRHPRSLDITPQGQNLYESARSVLWEMQHFEAKAASNLAELPSTLSIGLDSSLRSPLFTDCVARVFERFPSIDLTVLSGDTTQVSQWTVEGKVDMSLMLYNLDLDHRLSFSRAFNFEVVEVVSPKLNLGDQPVSTNQLRSMTQLFYQFIVDIDMSESQMLSHRRIHVSNCFQVLDMARAGMGWGAVPRFLCQPYLDDGSLVQLQIENYAREYWHANVAWLQDKSLDPALQLLLEEFSAIPDQ